MFNVAAALLFVLYNAWFQTLSGEHQSMASFLLPLMKAAVKLSTKYYVAHQLHNSDAAHAAGYFVECTSAAISAIIFTNIRDPITFVFILLVDVAENLFYGANMLACIIDMWKEKMDATVSMYQETLENMEVQEEGEDGEAEEASLMAANSPLSPHRQISLKNFKAHVDSAKDITYNSRIAFLSANLFFAEVVEFCVPLLMTFMSWSIYYLTDKCVFIDYMTDKTEEQFRRGLKYSLIDALLEFVVFVVIGAFLAKRVDVNVLAVGMHIIEFHASYFVSITIASCMFYQAIFIAQVGTDTSFQFSWLKDDYNATEAFMIEESTEWEERCYRPSATDLWDDV
jgi:hypothetical protein